MSAHVLLNLQNEFGEKDKMPCLRFSSLRCSNLQGLICSLNRGNFFIGIISDFALFHLAAHKRNIHTLHCAESYSKHIPLPANP